MSANDWVSRISSRPDLPLTLQTGLETLSRLDSEQEKKKHMDVLRKLRRREKTGDTAFELAASQSAATSIPVQAYPSLCPLESTPSTCCCHVPASELPLGNSHAVQALCGNPIDIATQKPVNVDEKRVQGESYMIGLPTLEESGWSQVAEGQAVQNIRNMAQKEYFRKCLALLGLTPVYHGLHGKCGLMLTFNKTETPGTLTEVRRLLDKLRTLNHANIVQLLMACEDETSLWLIYEECPGVGQIPYRLDAQQQFTDAEATRTLLQLAAAIAFCSKHGLALLDWSVWNLFTWSSITLNLVKVFGVGLAGTLYEKHLPQGVPSSSPLRNAFCYRAPELCRAQKEGHANVYERVDPREREATDIWSAAAVVFTGLTGHPPCHGVTEDEVHQNIIAGRLLDIRDTCECNIHAQGVSLIQRCLNAKPFTRPKAQDIFCNTWVLTVSTNNVKSEIDAIVARLYAYAQKGGVWCALGRLINFNLTPPKAEILEDLFSIVDIRGDGIVECEELISFAAHRRSEIVEIYDMIQADGLMGFTREEFFTANAFAPQILTERVVQEVFNSIDCDGSGVVTAAEFYEALANHHPTLSVCDVSEYLRAVDVNWDMELTSDEFKALFPAVYNSRAAAAKDRKHRAEYHQVAKKLSDVMYRTTEEWTKNLRNGMSKMKKARSRNEDFEEGGSIALVKEIQVMFKQIHRSMSRPATLTFPDEYATRIAQVLRVSKVEHKPMVHIESASGIMALDLYIRIPLQAWAAKLQKAEYRLKEAATIDIDAKGGLENRQNCTEEALSACINLLQKILTWAETYGEEQTSLLEVNDKPEQPMLDLKWSAKGRLGKMDTDDVQAQIDQVLVKSKQRNAAEQRDGDRLIINQDLLEEQSITADTLIKRIRPALSARFAQMVQRIESVTRSTGR